MKTIRSIVIANRGEIACRIIRTCKKMGIKTIALFSDADSNSLYVKMADIACNLPGNSPIDTYLNQNKIIQITKDLAADAIHPAYGFLSENASFAELCTKENIIFIGPNAEAIKKMGLKSESKSIMLKHNIPVIPGYNDTNQSIDTLKSEAVKIGFPLLIKASAGGGGKGMRIVRNIENLESEIISSKRECKSAFDNDHLILEKYIENARHIEIQIFGDKCGNVIPILERECTIQRRYQKIIEESPSPILSKEKREEMEIVATKVGQIIKYDNAGTVEFIYSDIDDSFYFLEVNTRLQVEHAVTEEITGLDLVKMQIESAEGYPLSITKKDISKKGYALEIRLYAEDVNQNYLPATGTILKWEEPKINGLRIDSAIETGSVISPFYDPMIAKIIMCDITRDETHRKMIYALENLVCLGVITNKDFIIQLLKNKDIAQGKYNTNYLDKYFTYTCTPRQEELIFFLIAISCFRYAKRNTKKDLIGWRNNFYQNQWDEYIIQNTDYRLEYKTLSQLLLFYFNEREYKVEIIDCKNERIVIIIDELQLTFYVVFEGNEFYLQQNSLGQLHIHYKNRFPNKLDIKTPGAYVSPIPAEIIEIKVKKNQEVYEGQTLFILSSMKIEIPIIAEKAGKVKEIFVENGQLVKTGILLINIE